MKRPPAATPETVSPGRRPNAASARSTISALPPMAVSLMSIIASSALTPRRRAGRLFVRAIFTPVHHVAPLVPRFGAGPFEQRQAHPHLLRRDGQGWAEPNRLGAGGQHQQSSAERRLYEGLALAGRPAFDGEHQAAPAHVA